MKSRHPIRIAFALLTASLVLPAALAEKADARGFERSVSRTGPRGQVRSAQQSLQVDRAAGRVERQRTLTGPEGQTRTRAEVVERTENGFTRNVVREGPKGVSTTDVVVERDQEAGRISRSADHVLPDGRTATTRTEILETENGSTRNTVRVGPNGQSLETEVERSFDPETDVATRTVTRTPGAQTEE